ncbi:hypothetical protein l13_09970 [Neisseria weaveri ATCC 51223]|nr:hypothetical protein l13_09970 [Neisseria weaveri ATCC 51223]
MTVSPACLPKGKARIPTPQTLNPALTSKGPSSHGIGQPSHSAPKAPADTAASPSI